MESLDVALLAEGVDRNYVLVAKILVPHLSPSSRRAWIEIVCGHLILDPAAVSPSSRRAWIEILI